MDHGEKSNISKLRKTRSKLGCFTCRKRKKKCDELLYPVCRNCNNRNLTCEWPLEKHELSKLLKKVVYVDDQDSKKSSSAPNAKPNKHHKNKSSTTAIAPISRNVFPIPPPSKKKSYFLQKIALQEDVTDEPEKLPQANDQDQHFTEQQIDQDLNIVLQQLQQQTVPESPKLEELEIFKFLDSEFLDP